MTLGQNPFNPSRSLPTLAAIQRRRRELLALDVTPEGLSRAQIRALFNRHAGKERIDLPLEQLMTLGLINSETFAGRGRPATLWAKVQESKVVGPET